MRKGKCRSTPREKKRKKNPSKRKKEKLGTHPVLVGEPVDAVALALAALRVGPVLVLHLAGDAHEVSLDDVVL